MAFARYRQGAVLFAPDVMVAALTVRGGTCSRALERALNERMGIVTSHLLQRCVLATLVELFDHDAETLARTALMLGGLCDSVGTVDEPGIPRGVDVTRLMVDAFVFGRADRIVVSPFTPGFGSRWLAGESCPYSAEGASWHNHVIQARDFVREGAFLRLSSRTSSAEVARLGDLARAVARRGVEARRRE